MISKWFNTKIQEASKMMDVTDEDILSWSSGEVNVYDDEKGTGGLMDPNIFGNLENYSSLRMGHITMAYPVVNINHIRKHPDLQDALGLSLRDLESLIYCSKLLVGDHDNVNIVDFKNVGTYEICLYGAEAIEYLLKKKEISDKYILHYLPVLPLQTRYLVQDGKVYEFHLNYLTRRVVIRNNRLKKLMEIGAPEIILRNEKRMLQEYVDAYINNGLRGIPILSKDGRPAESLAYLDEKISRLYPIKKNYKRPEFADAEKAEIEASVLAYQKFLYPEDGEQSEAETESYEERRERLEEEIEEAIAPAVSRMVEDNCRMYEDFVEAIKKFTTDTVIRFFEQRRNEIDFECVTEAMLTGMSCYIDKQLTIKYE